MAARMCSSDTVVGMDSVAVLSDMSKAMTADSERSPNALRKSGKQPSHPTPSMDSFTVRVFVEVFVGASMLARVVLWAMVLNG